MNEKKTLTQMNGDETIDAVIEALKDMNKVTIRIPEISLLEMFLIEAKKKYADEKKQAYNDAMELWYEKEHKC